MAEANAGTSDRRVARGASGRRERSCARNVPRGDAEPPPRHERAAVRRGESCGRMHAWPPAQRTGWPRGLQLLAPLLLFAFVHQRPRPHLPQTTSYRVCIWVHIAFVLHVACCLFSIESQVLRETEPGSRASGLARLCGSLPGGRRALAARHRRGLNETPDLARQSLVLKYTMRAPPRTRATSPPAVVALLTFRR